MPVVAKMSLQVSLEHYREHPVAPATVSVASLWEHYRTSADPWAREELLKRHLSLVHFVARRMAARTSAAEYGELVSAGALGLLSALEAFDPARGYAFSTYAVARIRGAILDDLRRQDWMPRSCRTRSRRLAAARAQLQSRLLRAPRPAEVALELGLNLETYWRWCDELDAPALDADRTSPGRGVQTGGVGDRPAHEPTEDASADRRLLREEEAARVRAAIEQLPEREWRVLALCYYEELTLKEVGELLGVTESRISQIRQQALRRLTGLLQG
jgi:RNA polymerase sigma factor for flagellar operon FliA